MYCTANEQEIKADVVVVGAGLAGLSATAAAIENGCSVVLLETSSRVGGNAVYSTGWVAFVDTEMQRKAGLKDTEDIFLADCQKMVDNHQHLYGIMYDNELTKIFARKSHHMYDRLIARGARFTSLATRPLQASVDRLHVIEDTEMFASIYEPELQGERCSVFLNTSATKILTNLEGGVTGVVASSGNFSFNIMARRGVILTTGGYQANQAFRKRFQLVKDNESPWYAGIASSRGDGHMLGAAIGGDLVNMNVIPPIVMVASRLLQEGIAVNENGERFHDEAGPYFERVKTLREQPDSLAYYVWDAEANQRHRKYVSQLPGEIHKAGDLASLASKIQVSSKGLEHSVRQWNEFLATKEERDPVTGRVLFSPERFPIAKGPFYASQMCVGISLTCGGFRTTKSMQVMHVLSGQPIPGLFAAGDTSGIFTATADMGGTHLGGAVTLGWEAGEAVATGRTSEPHVDGDFGKSLPALVTEDRSAREGIVTGVQTSQARL